MGMRMYGYARVTHAEQESESSSLAIQKSAIEKHCAENSYELVSIYEDVANDNAEDIMNERPGWTQILADLKSKEDNIDGLVVLDVDRLGRNTDSMAYVRRNLRKRDVEIYSIHQPDYKILPHITIRQSLDELIAEWDHDKLVNRLEAGRAKAKAEREELATLQRFKPSRHSNKNPYLFL